MVNIPPEGENVHGLPGSLPPPNSPHEPLGFGSDSDPLCVSPADLSLCDRSLRPFGCGELQVKLFDAAKVAVGKKMRFL